MRYNSLRSQLNWHSRQQTHIFKKINKEGGREGEKEGERTGEEVLKGNELIWLEKMMKELHQYKEETQEQEKGKKKEVETVETVIRDKNIRGASDRHQKIVVNLDEPAKSAKKIKFEIVINPDKHSSAKKITTLQPKSKPKSVKKPASKTLPKKNCSERVSAGRESSAGKEANSSKEIKVSCPSNTKVIDVETIKTDPYSFKEADLQILDQLWRKEEKAVEPEPKLSSKKSVGKIIRNSDKLNKTCIQMAGKDPKAQSNNISINTANNSVQNTSYKQYKQSQGKQSASIHSFDSKEIYEFREPPSIDLTQQLSKEIRPQQSKALPQNQKLKYEKIYIKLQTEKLSQYLSQKSQVKEQNCSEKIETNEYEKYCETKRIERVNPPQQPEKKSFTNQKRQSDPSTEKAKEESAPRAKSEQRKLNKFAQIVRPTKLFDFEPRTKPTIKSIEQSKVSVAEVKQKQVENKIQIKLKRKYDYKEEQLPNKAQKLFTLHSVASDYSSNQEFKEAKNPVTVSQQQQSRPSFSLQIEQQPSFPSQPTQSQTTIPEHNTNSHLSLSQSHFKESVVVKDFDPLKTDYTEQLTLLFNFLDEGRRGLLTDTNCHFELLTEQLKLLFSVILNQIRTKKRFYNLPKFIEESKEILMIKNEVYNSNNKSAENKNMVYQILKENIDILRKKLPLMFVKFSYTQSCFENSSAQSKKNSITQGQSFVIDKLHFDHTMQKKEIEDCIFSESTKERNNDCIRLEVPEKSVTSELKLQKGRKDKENIEKYQSSYRKFSKKSEDTRTELDLLQPQIYLQRKYGFGKNKEDQSPSSNEKMSSMFLKTRGYLQNLDSYLKIR